MAARLTLGNPLLENQFSANGENVVQVTGGTLAGRDETWTPQGDLNTYRVVSNDITVPAGRTWTLAPGVNVQFDFGRGAQVAGTLVAEGSRGAAESASPAPDASPRLYPATGKGSRSRPAAPVRCAMPASSSPRTASRRMAGTLNVISSTDRCQPGGRHPGARR